MAREQGQRRPYPDYRTVLVSESYLVSLFCRPGKPSHSHCKDPAQIAHCGNQSEASLAGPHWLQTQKFMVMFKHTQLKLIPLIQLCQGEKTGAKSLLLDIFLTVIFKCGLNEFYNLNALDLIHGLGLLSELPYHQKTVSWNLGEGVMRRTNGTSWEWDYIKADSSE